MLPAWLSDNELNAMARENNLPVTTFLVRDKEKFNIRWITPEYELDICGHGSLSAGYIIFNYLEPELKKVNLQSRIEALEVLRDKDLITLNFPVKNIESCFLSALEEGLGVSPNETYQHNDERCFAVLGTEEEVRQLKPNMNILKKLPHRGITVTAPGKESDYVSRTFYLESLLVQIFK